jgi:hypothetical protein
MPIKRIIRNYAIPIRLTITPPPKRAVLCVAKVLGKRVIFPRPLQISCSSLFGK